jgi:AcrR family transcriptional regulator
MSDVQNLPVPPAKTGDKPRDAQRFTRMRKRILNAATELINERGMKATTLLDVASAVDLNTTSITYYFRKKEILAAAVFEQTLSRLEAMAAEAFKAPTPQSRVERLLQLNIELHAQVICGKARPLASLSEIRTLKDAARKPLVTHYKAVFRQIRAFFGPERSEMHKALLTARTHILLETLFWLPNWIGQYAIADFPRVHGRLSELLSTGFAKPPSSWTPQHIAPVDDEAYCAANGGRADFLRVATRLINESGYRGASVDRIVAELNVTKGSFYHHLDAKDDLVLECFRISYKRVARVQSLTDAAGGDRWRRISSAVAALLKIQFKGEWPLLRTSALRALPASLRADVVARSNRMALHFAGMLVDGVSDGSLRPVDPLIASQMIMATLNTAYDLRNWASRLPSETAIALYASALVDGMFNDRVLEIV